MRLRYLPGGVAAFATPGGQNAAGWPAFGIGAGESRPLHVDLSGLLGADTLAGAAWTSEGITTAGASTDGNTASVTVTAPSGGVCLGWAKLTATSAAGATHVRTVAFLVEPR